MDSINRRDFLGMSLGAIAAIGALGTLGAVKKTWDPLPSVVKGGFTIVDISQLNVGELKTFEWRGQPVYVIRKDPSDSKVDGRDFEIDGNLYSLGLQVCTHLGCIPKYSDGDRKFHCGCHGGVFNSSGVQLSGPPPRPMSIPPFKVDGTKIIFGEEGEEYKTLVASKESK